MGVWAYEMMGLAGVNFALGADEARKVATEDRCRKDPRPDWTVPDRGRYEVTRIFGPDLPTSPSEHCTTTLCPNVV